MSVLTGKYCKYLAGFESYSALLLSRSCRTLCKRIVCDWCDRDIANIQAEVIMLDISRLEVFHGSRVVNVTDIVTHVAFDQSEKMMRRSVNTRKSYNNIWVPELLEFREY